MPPGNGIDTHRVWETLLVGGIPIVEKNDLYTEFTRQGVPLIMLDNWEIINVSFWKKLFKSFRMYM